MTFKILKDDTQNIACRSNVLPGDNPLTRNLRLYPATMPAIIKSRNKTFSNDDTVSTAASTIHDNDSYQATASMPVVETSDLVGRSH